MKKTVFYFLLLSAVCSCKNRNQSRQDVETQAEKPVNNTAEGGEWQYLFDGTSTEGWRGYNEESLPENWMIEDGTLKTLGLGGDSSGDIVYGKEEFEEFELSLEWKMAEGGNSGIFYHIIEDDKYATAYMTGPEYQVMTRPIETGSEMQSIGADYGMYPTQYKGDTSELSDRWNTSRIKFTRDKVTYWLNGEKTVEFVPWSEDWEQRKKEGKWNDFPDYGKAQTGLIGLQDHGSVAWFKDIKIRRL